MLIVICCCPIRYKVVVQVIGYILTFHDPFLLAPTRSMIPFLRKPAKTLLIPASDSCRRRESTPIVMRGSATSSLTIRCSDLDNCVSVSSDSAFSAYLSCTFPLLLFFTLFSTLFFTSCRMVSNKQRKMNSMKWVILAFSLR